MPEPEDPYDRRAMDREYEARKIIGRNFQRLRTYALLSQEMVAQDIGMPGSGASGIEVGRVRIQADRYALIAAAFGISVEELIVGQYERRNV